MFLGLNSDVYKEMFKEEHFFEIKLDFNVYALQDG